MKDAEKILDAIKKDWELIPNPSKALLVFSAAASWYVAAEWKTPRYKHIFFVSVLALNFVVFLGFAIYKPWKLRGKYSFKNFLDGKFEFLDDGGIWYIVDHDRKTVRWIANYATLVELGLRHLAKKRAPLKPPLPDTLEGGRLEDYKTGRYIMILGRRGGNIKEE